MEFGSLAMREFLIKIVRKAVRKELRRAQRPRPINWNSGEVTEESLVGARLQSQQKMAAYESKLRDKEVADDKEIQGHA